MRDLKSHNLPKIDNDINDHLLRNIANEKHGKITCGRRLNFPNVRHVRTTVKALRLRRIGRLLTGSHDAWKAVWIRKVYPASKWLHRNENKYRKHYAGGSIER